MKVDFKTTIWERFDIPEELEELVKKEIHDREIQSGSELADFLDEHGHDIKWEHIDDSCEYMDPEDNNGMPTLEIMEYHDRELGYVVTWDNGK